MAEQFDKALIHAVNLARVESGSVKKVVETLEKLAKDLQKKLVDAGDDLSPAKLARTKKVLAGAETTISQYYDAIADDMSGTLAGVAGTEGKQAAKLVNSALGVEAFDSLITEKQAEALVDEDVIFGHSSRDWWAAQDERLRFRFRGEITEGVLMGESTDDLIRRIRGTRAGGFRDGIMTTSKHEAETLVRSSVQTVSNEARIRGFQENDDVVKGIEWVSTLDGRTTNICKALDGLQWDLDGNPMGHNKAFPGPTAHWRCRSTQVSVTYGWDELAGKKIGKSEEKYEDAFRSALAEKGFDEAAIAEAVAGQRASMGGPVSATQTFEDWLANQSDDFAERLLGEGRYGLWQAGEISLRDLTNQYGRELTVKELRTAVETGTLPTSAPAVAAEGLSIANFTAAELKAAEKQLTLDAEADAQAKIDGILADPQQGEKQLAKYLKWAQGLDEVKTAQQALSTAEEALAEYRKQKKLKKWLKQSLTEKGPTPAQVSAFENLAPDEKAEWAETLKVEKAGKKTVMEAAQAGGVAEKQVWKAQFGNSPSTPKLGGKTWAEAADEYEAALAATKAKAQEKALQSKAAKKLAEQDAWLDADADFASAPGLTAKQEEAVAVLAGDPAAQEEFKSLVSSWKAKLQKDAAPAPTAPDLTPKADVPAFGPGANTRTVRQLGGSTGAELIEDRETGKFWVRKRGASADHLREEATADALYRAAGAKVPASIVREESGGLTKYSEWLDGDSLDEVLRSSTDIAAVRADLQENAVADMLFGNWDVIGAARDNVLIVGGRAIRIDNGGSLRFRAQGGRKPAGKFAREVEELRTFFDRSINPQTSDIYGGMAQADIDRQIQALVARRESILAAVPGDDVELRDILAARLDYLEEQLPQGLRGTSQTERALRSRIAADLDPEIGTRIDETRGNGLDTLMDEDLVEDNSVVMWRETAADGTTVTKAQLKVTAAGSKTVTDRLKDAMAAAKVSDPSASTPDPEWNTVLTAAKTAGYHVQDGKYSQPALANLKQLKGQLSGDSSPKSAHYLAAIEEIEDAIANRRAPKKITKFEPPATAATAAKEATEWQDLRRESSWRHQLKEAKGGDLTETTVTNADLPVQAGVYRMRRGDADVTFIPSPAVQGARDGKALEGLIEVRVTRPPGVESATDVRETIEALGIPSGRPSPERLEALAIHKTLYLRNKTTPEYEARFRDRALSDEDRLRIARDEHAKQIGPVMRSGEDVVEYPAGGGRVRFLRTDLAPDTIEKKLGGGFSLFHESNQGIKKAVLGMLESGGLATPSTGRIRKGVRILAEGGGQIGMSPFEDFKTGGADYFFTRVKRQQGLDKFEGIRFKIGALNRSDAVSQGRDTWGNTDAFSERVSEIADYRKLGGKGGNETNFKGGLSLIDEVELIQVIGDGPRDEIIQAFRAAGHDRLPDGRPIEEVVVNVQRK